MSSDAIYAGWLRLRQRAQPYLLPLWRRAAAVPAARWRALLTALLAAWIIADLARLPWLLLPATPAVAVLPVNAASVAVRRSAVVVDIDRMAGWHLFGEAGVTPRAAVVPGVEEQARETTLNLQLLGVIVASDPAQARAFIQAEGQQKQYAIGEQLPGSGRVLLSKVLVDRVIIDNNGRYETLWLYDPNSKGRQPVAVASAPGAAVDDMRDNPQVSALAERYRDQLYKDPASLADVIQVAPAMADGKLIGYRVNPGRDRAQFDKFGLLPGDVVVGINDVALDDPQHALALYNLLRNAREATVTVQRGDQRLVLRVALDGGRDDD